MRLDVQAAARKLSGELADAGKIIEGGWEGFRLMVVPTEASQVQVQEMRLTFFAGAQHLFASIMCILEAGEEPTEGDMRRMSLIHEELESFKKGFELKHLPTDGSA